ncbi:acyl-CoA--6-aminopenicillanic acid acyl-transferase [Thalassobacillus devorans]|uniref:Acyl-CoA--6-aminopenicillanic acid acyl-transferase n=1 Tax=Thalassobacillus devorans TaxID=279813 RepID=A0ABQ1NJ67_9BACI|nr:C45 family peptidase [Thalassobacillus devorans]NIK27275.1 isopenicillin-N N-acyltransferase-like protein [Thalassobacillus devorans]GGC76379.1 acyl-CoA--6-aminopenicillanic acid acyl-transferase [Thalassobacillus devorans]
MNKTSKKDEVIILSGSSFEIGFQHGQKAKKQVTNSLQTYEKMFEEYSSMSWKDAIEKACLHISAIEKYNENFLKEMEGLAKGAGVTFEDVLVLNARSEIALINSMDGCTAFALTQPKTTKTWLAQNWDWKGEQTDSIVQLDIEQEALPSIQMITEAGIIGKIGMNNSGIGVCLNALVTDTWKPKVPIHLGLRSILESASLEEAYSKVANDQMASAAHFLIASRSEEMVSMEVSPVHTAERHVKGGTLTHTNHICSENMKKEVKEDALPDSFSRFSSVNNLVAQIKEKDIGKEDLFEILSSHENYPSSICRHSSPTQVGRAKMETVFSIVMNLTDSELSWSKGKPCKR